ncbi:uncharacterized protein [Rutidosis leptorrhynchoides]|uniref:uncharacterized protein n=1 Tax=Rutidosis leptorrhynchoides TaxID=125765 RepID=UPI003A9A2733
MAIDAKGIDFSSSFVKDIGNGLNVSFWHDRWVGEYTLKNKFAKLFELEEDKNVSVADRVDIQDNRKIFKWQWVGPFRGRSIDELQNITSIVSSVQLNNYSQDKWKYTLESDGVFRTKGLSSLILSSTITSTTNSSTLRNKALPLKVEIFIWRANQLRLPVRIELDKRGIDLDSVLCPICKKLVESVEHSF